MPRPSDFSAKNLPVLGTWVYVRAQRTARRATAGTWKGGGVHNADRALAATPALVTSVEPTTPLSDSSGPVPKWHACVIYPNPLVLMGFGRGAPFKRVDAVLVERLRVVDSRETSQLEKAMRAAVDRCALQGPGEDRFVEDCLVDVAEIEACQQALANVSHDEENVGSPSCKSSSAAELASEGEVVVKGRPKALGAETGAQIEVGGDAKVPFESEGQPSFSRSRSRSRSRSHSRSCSRSRSRSRSQLVLRGSALSAALTPQRRSHLGSVERTLRRVQSEEKAELPKLQPELALTIERKDKPKLRKFTAAVSKELSTWPNWRMEAEGLMVKLISDFSLTEISSGLEILEVQNKIVIADQIVFAVM